MRIGFRGLVDLDQFTTEKLIDSERGVSAHQYWNVMMLVPVKQMRVSLKKYSEYYSTNVVM